MKPLAALAFAVLAACASAPKPLAVIRTPRLTLHAERSRAPSAREDDRLPPGPQPFWDPCSRQVEAGKGDLVCALVAVRELELERDTECTLLPRDGERPFARIVRRSALDAALDARLARNEVWSREWRSLFVAQGGVAGSTSVEPRPSTCGNDEWSIRRYRDIEPLRRTWQVRAEDLAAPGGVELDVRLSQTGRAHGGTLTRWSRDALDGLVHEELALRVTLARDEALVIGNLRDVDRRPIVCAFVVDFDPDAPVGAPLFGR